MQHDPWLQRWLPTIGAHANGKPVLEIGCGSGDDTRTLTAAGLQVVAFDLSAEAVDAARRQAPTARIEQRDIRDALPAHAGGYGVAIASLSRHYFSWAETLSIAGRIRQALAPDGLLLCRLNSTEDHHFGASGHPAIEPHYYRVDGSPKRFFDEAAVRAMFADGWTLVSLEHVHTDKYGPSKALWEAVVRVHA